MLARSPRNKQMGIRVDEATRQRIRALAAQLDLSNSATVTVAIDQYIKALASSSGPVATQDRISPASDAER